MLLRKQNSPYIWVTISGFFGLIFGALCAIPNLIISGIGAAISYWIAGIPFDIIHAVGNFAVALLLFHPLYRVLDGINKRTTNMH